MSIDELLPCAILIPSLDRPHRLRSVVDNIHQATPEAHRIMFCVGEPRSKAVLDEIGEWYLDDTDDADKRYVTRMNKLVKHIGDAKTVFFGSDDYLHHDGWLAKALSVMAKGYALVVPNDLHNPNGTAALVRSDYLDRAVFDEPGAAFHGGYHHNFADTEQFFTAHLRGEFARAVDSLVEHLHPVWNAPNSLPWDDTYRNVAMNSDYWAVDQQLFRERAEKAAMTLRPDIAVP